MKTVAFGENIADEVLSGDSVKMSIDPNSIDHLMLNLTNLYADPVLAVIREYASNAYDSHIRAGVETPILVSYPTSGSPFFTVEDFGVGMSKQEIIDIYSKYGLSTKNNTNTEIGAFGLGAKSALAITDRFDITARKDGLETIAYVEKNSKGVGVVHFVSETPTTQPNGFKITVPADGEGLIYRFDTHRDFFDTWVSHTVTVDGVPAKGVQYQDNWIEVNPTGVSPVGWVEVCTKPQSPRSHWGYINLQKSISFSIEGIIYSFNDRSEWLNSVFSAYGEELVERIRQTITAENKVILNVPIGSVDLTPNRESLMATEKTTETLKNLIVDFFDNVHVSASAYLNRLERWEGMFFVANNLGLVTVETSSVYSLERSVVSNSRPEFYDVSWNGENIPTWVAAEDLKVAWTDRQAKSVSWAKYVPLLETFNRDGYSAQNFAFIVETGDMKEETLELVRKNVKDYVKSLGVEVNNFVALITDDRNVLDNVWVQTAYRVVSVSDLYESALQVRRSRRVEAAKSSSPRSSISYAFADFSTQKNDKAALLQYVTAETVGSGAGYVFISIDDEKSPAAYSLHHIEDSIMEVMNRKEGVEKNIYNDFVYAVSPALQGKKAVFLNKNKKSSAFQKRHPESVSLQQAVVEYVEKTLAAKTFSYDSVVATVSFQFSRRNTPSRLRDSASGTEQKFLSSSQNMVKAAENVKNVADRIVAPALKEAVSSIAHKTDLFRFSLLFSAIPEGVSKKADRLFLDAHELNYAERLSLLSNASGRYVSWSESEQQQAIILMNNI